MFSCIYEGTVSHRRREPVDHRFQYRLFMVYLDLDELPSLVGRSGMFAGNRRASRSFLRSDHLFDNSVPLADEVREMIRQRTGETAKGPIRLLTQLRYFGYFMSPLNLFYLFDRHDQRVEYIVAEVNNTPWNERHCYVLWDGNGERKSQTMRFAHPKDFHVSPFMSMDMNYQWKVTTPGEHLHVQLANTRDSKRLFDATLTLHRRELNRNQLRRMTLQFPVMTAQISAAIYFQALQLWWKKCPFYVHPKTRINSPSPAPPSPILTETNTVAPR